MISSQSPETVVAAEFTQMAFETSLLDIPVGGRMSTSKTDILRVRRSSPNKPAASRKRADSPWVGMLSDSAAEASDSTSQEPNQNNEVLLYDCEVTKGQRYKVIIPILTFSAACWFKYLPSLTRSAGIPLGTPYSFDGSPSWINIITLDDRLMRRVREALAAL